MQHLPFRLTLTDRIMIKEVRKSVPLALHASFDEALSSILLSEHKFLTDQVTQSHIIFAASVLCAYRQLIDADIDVQEARKILVHRLKNIGRRVMKVLMFLAFGLSKNPLNILRKYSEDKAREGYGPSFTIENHDICGGFVSQVKVCGYRSFLSRHNALELNDVLCEWDNVWIKALPKSIKFSRPQTLAQGCNSCRFEFRLNEDDTTEHN